MRDEKMKMRRSRNLFREAVRGEGTIVEEVDEVVGAIAEEEAKLLEKKKAFLGVDGRRRGRNTRRRGRRKQMRNSSETRRQRHRRIILNLLKNQTQHLSLGLTDLSVLIKPNRHSPRLINNEILLCISVFGSRTTGVSQKNPRGKHIWRNQNVDGFSKDMSLVVSDLSSINVHLIDLSELQYC
jgi:hypothetical protein